MAMKNVASKMGIKPSTFSKMLTLDNPRRDTMNRIAEAFGVSFEEFEQLYHNPEGYEISYKSPISDGADAGIMIVPKEYNRILSNHNAIALHNDESTDKEDAISLGIRSDIDDIIINDKREKQPESILLKNGDGGYFTIRKDEISADIKLSHITLHATNLEELYEIASILYESSKMDARRAMGGSYQAVLSLLIKQYGNKG